MRIIILGGPGTGKNWLGERLSKKKSVPHYDTDDILWKKKYTSKRTREERKKKINSIAKKKDWIIAGAAKEWLGDAPKKADEIVILQEHILCVLYRILKRFIYRVFTGKPNGGPLGWYKVAKWGYDNFHKENGEGYQYFKRLQKKYPDKVKFLDKHGKHQYLSHA